MATDTKDLQQLVTFVAKLANGIGQGLADGKLSITDLVNFLPALEALPAAVVGIQNVPAELAALSADDRAALVASFEAQFSIPESGIEAAIESAIDVALRILNMVPLFKKA